MPRGWNGVPAQRLVQVRSVQLSQSGPGSLHTWSTRSWNSHDEMPSCSLTSCQRHASSGCRSRACAVRSNTASGGQARGDSGSWQWAAMSAGCFSTGAAGPCLIPPTCSGRGAAAAPAQLSASRSVAAQSVGRVLWCRGDMGKRDGSAADLRFPAREPCAAAPAVCNAGSSPSRSSLLLQVVRRHWPASRNSSHRAGRRSQLKSLQTLARAALLVRRASASHEALHPHVGSCAAAPGRCAPRCRRRRLLAATCCSPSLPQLLLARLLHPIPVIQLFCLIRFGMSAGRHRQPMLPCWCHPVVCLPCRVHCSGQPGPPNWQGLSGRLCSQLWCRGCDKSNGRDSHTVRLLFCCCGAPAGHTAVGTHAAAGEPTVPHSPLPCTHTAGWSCRGSWPGVARSCIAAQCKVRHCFPSCRKGACAALRR